MSKQPVKRRRTPEEILADMRREQEIHDEKRRNREKQEALRVKAAADNVAKKQRREREEEDEQLSPILRLLIAAQPITRVKLAEIAAKQPLKDWQRVIVERVLGPLPANSSVEPMPQPMRPEADYVKAGK